MKCIKWMIVCLAAATAGTTARAWTDDMNNNFAPGWSVDSEAGSWWWQSSAGINWAIDHSYSTATKGRCEVSRTIFHYNGGEDTGTIEGKFKMETTADGYTNDGGWVMQTMLWHFQDPSGTVQYKPLVVVRMLANKIDYLVYDYVWDSANHPTVKSGYPKSVTLATGAMAGQVKTIAIKIHFSRTSNGEVWGFIDGSYVPGSYYKGQTFPAIFPYNNQEIRWKGGVYSSYYGTHHAKIGVYYLSTDFM